MTRFGDNFAFSKEGEKREWLKKDDACNKGEGYQTNLGALVISG